MLKEHLAYQIYNALTDKSLRARLARMTYHDTSGRTESLTRYAFFVEHFDSLAKRHDAVVWKPERFDVLDADPVEMATLDVFEYMIGNTDWSAVFNHNVVLIRDAAGRATAVPYDFDFSGLVDAEYASVAPELPIRHVTAALVPRRLQAGHRLAARVLGVPGATWRDRALGRARPGCRARPRTTRSAISTASSQH